MQNNKNGNTVVDKKKIWRHGELGFLKISKLPKGLKETKTNLLQKGSHGHDHTFINGKFYQYQDGFTFGYLVAKDTSLLHPEHSPNVGEALLPNGYYQLIKQTEYTPSGLIPVID